MDGGDDVIDLTQSPPDPTPAPPLHLREVSVQVPVTHEAPLIRPRVLFIPVGSLAAVEVKISEDCRVPVIFY